jgi:hypothetical protein
VKAEHWPDDPRFPSQIITFAAMAFLGGAVRNIPNKKQQQIYFVQ